MNVKSFEDGIEKLTRMASSPLAGQFPKIAVILESTVKFYVANVDKLHPEVLEFQQNLTKGIYNSPEKSKPRNKRQTITKPRPGSGLSDFSRIEPTFCQTLDVKITPVSCADNRYRQYRSFDHFWGALRFDPLDFQWADVSLLDRYRDTDSKRWKIGEKFRKYECFLNTWAFREEPISTWLTNEENWVESKATADRLNNVVESDERLTTSVSSSSSSSDEEIFFDLFPTNGSGDGNFDYNSFDDAASGSSRVDEHFSPEVDSAYETCPETPASSTSQNNVTDDPSNASLSGQPSSPVENSTDKDQNKAKERKPKRKKSEYNVKKCAKKVKRSGFTIMDLDAPVPKSKKLNIPNSSNVNEDAEIEATDFGVCEFNDDLFNLPEPQTIGTSKTVTVAKKSKLSTKKDDAGNGNEDVGVCMRTYRKNVMAWFEDKQPEEPLDFADQLRGQPMEEIPRHLLATLHLACEGKLEISSEPFVMDKISIKKI